MSAVSISVRSNRETIFSSIQVKLSAHVVFSHNISTWLSPSRFYPFIPCCGIYQDHLQNLYILLSRPLFVASYPFGNSNLIFFNYLTCMGALAVSVYVPRVCPMPVETEEVTGSMGLMELQMVVRCCMGAGNLTWVLRNRSQCSKQCNLPFPSSEFPLHGFLLFGAANQYLVLGIL